MSLFRRFESYSLTKAEIEALIKESLAKSKAALLKAVEGGQGWNASHTAPKFWPWNSWPAGNETYRNWLTGESSRRGERKSLRRLLRKGLYKGSPLDSGAAMKNPSVSAAWPTMKSRSRRAALEFAGVGEDRAYGYSQLDWSDLPSEVKSVLLRGWHMASVGGTTRRYRDTTRRMPVLTNPASEEFKRRILSLFSAVAGSQRTKDIARAAFGSYPSDKDQRSVAKALEELARAGALRGELHSEYDYTQVRGGHFGASKIAMKRRRWRWYLPDAKHPPGLFDMTKGGSARKNPTEGWAVTQDGETLKQFGPGTKGANAAFAWLHKRQGQSVDWAVQYSGYDMVNVEGGKVVYSYKRSGLKKLTNRRNGTKGAYPFKEKAEQYRRLTIAELLYARKDAAEAARAMKGHDLAAENWYWDDSFTISDEITRRRHGLKNPNKSRPNPKRGYKKYYVARASHPLGGLYWVAVPSFESLPPKVVGKVFLVSARNKRDAILEIKDPESRWMKK